MATRKPKQMQVGGNPLSAGAIPARALAEAQIEKEMAGRLRDERMPVMKKRGGTVESVIQHKAETKRIGALEKGLKSHIKKPAAKAHASTSKAGKIKKYACGGEVDGFKVMKKSSTW
jgi:hypothetical protein